MADISLTDCRLLRITTINDFIFNEKFQYVSSIQSSCNIYHLRDYAFHLAYHNNEHLYFSSEHILLNKVLPKF
jgi:hypothetical protein